MSSCRITQRRSFGGSKYARYAKSYHLLDQSTLRLRVSNSRLRSRASKTTHTLDIKSQEAPNLLYLCPAEECRDNKDRNVSHRINSPVSKPFERVRSMPDKIRGQEFGQQRQGLHFFRHARHGTSASFERRK